MLQRLREDEPQAEKPLVELDSLRRTDWVRHMPPTPTRAQRGHRPGAPPRAKGHFPLLVGQPCGKASWESLVAKPRGKASRECHIFKTQFKIFLDWENFRDHIFIWL